MDQNDTLPNGGTVADSTDDLDFRQSVDALADILDDPDDQDTGENEDNAEEVEEEAEAETDDESEDSDTEDAEEGEDGPEELKGGRIAPKSAKVQMPDGTLTTVEELTKGYLRQSDYTRKRQEDAEVRKALDADRSRVSQTAQHLQQQHELMESMLEQWKPRPPQDPQNDPMGWISYQQQLDAWGHWKTQLENTANERRTKEQAELQEQGRQIAIRERTELSRKIPALADDTKLRTFLNEAGKVLGEYGITQQEVDQIGDHRMFLAIRDLMRAKRLAAKAPEVREQIKGKPKMVTGSRRSDPAAAKAKGKEARLSRLRETGSRADGIRSLQDLDL